MKEELTAEQETELRAEMFSAGYDDDGDIDEIMGSGSDDSAADADTRVDDEPSNGDEVNQDDESNELNDGEEQPSSDGDGDDGQEDDDGEEEQHNQYSDELKAQIEALRAENAKATEALQARLRKAEGHVGNLISQINNRNKVKQDEANKVKQAEITSKLEAVKEEFPELNDFVEIVKKQSNAKPVDVEAIRAEFNGRLSNELGTKVQEIEQNFERRLLKFAHSDYEQILNDPKYQAWIVKQPEDRQKLTASPVAEDAIKLLDFYKEDSGTQKTAADIRAERAARLNQSQATPHKRGKPKKQKSVEQMTDEEYRAYEFSRP